MKITTFIFALLTTPLFLFANGGEDPQKKTTKKYSYFFSDVPINEDYIRGRRKIAITLDGGWNTLGANGILASYYILPQFGADLGVGLGLKGLKIGLRAKYMFSKKRFSPFVGFGISGRHFSNQLVTSTEVTENGVEELKYYAKNVAYAQPTIGFEFMSKHGFVVGMSTGYSIALNKPYEIESGESEIIENSINLVWGSGIIATFNIGYAF